MAGNLGTTMPDEHLDEQEHLRIQLRKPPDRSAHSQARGMTMFRQPIFAGLLVFSGVLCVVVSVHSGTTLDTAYVQWSSVKVSTESHSPDASKPPQYTGFPLAGAPLSVLSPTLIWLSFFLGLLLIVLGLVNGFLALRRQRLEYDKIRLTGHFADDDPSER
jgi:hypothetical protein